MSYQVKCLSDFVIPPRKINEDLPSSGFICKFPDSISLLPDTTMKIDLKFKLEFPSTHILSLTNYEENLSKFQVLPVTFYSDYTDSLYCYIRSFSKRKELVLAGEVVCIMNFSTGCSSTPFRLVDIIRPESLPQPIPDPLPHANLNEISDEEEIIEVMSEPKYPMRQSYKKSSVFQRFAKKIKSNKQDPSWDMEPNYFTVPSDSDDDYDVIYKYNQYK